MQASPQTTLRAHLESLRAQGRAMDVAHAIGVVVPLAVELAEQHRQGYTFFLYPSALYLGQDDQYHVAPNAAEAPIDPRDRACLPPESAGTTPGQSRASVFGIAAILYELLTLQSAGPGMRRPSELASGIPETLDGILAKALVRDPAHRPDDLNALAQALYQINHQFTAPPPPADVTHLDHDNGIDVDVSMSLMPPAPKPEPLVVENYGRPPGLGGPSPASGGRNTPDDLHAIKARLESDPAPRYMVIRQGMDHGPFRAVELLQQLASHTFDENDSVKVGAADPVPIKEHPDFCHFARHARMHRAEKAEKAAIAQAVVAESRSTKGKTLVGLVALLVLGALAGTYVITKKGQKNDEIHVVEEVAANVESDAGLKVKSKAGGGGPRVVGTSGGFPQLGGGMSCEAAQNAYVEEMKMGVKGQADLTAGQFQASLGNGAYLNSCGVPDSMSVNICAAIQNGRAVGVTVVTTPRNPGVAGCISSRVRSMSFPSHPKLDVTRTTFAAN